MEFIGDVWAAFTGALYEFRIPLIVASIVAVVGFVIFARRRGWIDAARRHPGRSIALGLAVLAVGLPLAWYTASPLFVRTQLVEPAPVAAVPSATTTPAAVEPTVVPSDTGPSASPIPSRTPAPTPTPFAPSEVASGAFYGSDDFHFANGTATIIEVEPGRYHLRLEDFSVRNGPDLYVYLSPKADGYAKGALELGTLKATDGSFGYDLPAGTDPAEYRSAVIWCKQFSHLFGTAPFEDG